MLRVLAAQDVTDELFAAVERLLPQLSSSARLPTRAELGQIVLSPATTLLVAREDEAVPANGDGGEQGWASGDDVASGSIVGMLTLVTFRIPTGVRAWIEDVVVDAAFRRRGVGEALTQAALEVASARGARTADLTSRPKRENANRLYERMGFELRDTNVYRYQLGS